MVFPPVGKMFGAAIFHVADQYIALEVVSILMDKWGHEHEDIVLTDKSNRVPRQFCYLMWHTSLINAVQSACSTVHL